MDEYSCLDVCAKIINKGSAGRLLFDLHENQLPKYPLGVALRRGDGEVRAYVEEALSTFLDADYEWVGREYRDLFKRLRTHAQNANLSPEHAHSWAVKTLRLQDVHAHRVFLLPQPWRRALLHAHELLFHDQSDHGYRAIVEQDGKETASGQRQRRMK